MLRCSVLVRVDHLAVRCPNYLGTPGLQKGYFFMAFRHLELVHSRLTSNEGTTPILELKHLTRNTRKQAGGRLSGNLEYFNIPEHTDLPDVVLRDPLGATTPKIYHTIHTVSYLHLVTCIRNANTRTSGHG